MLDVLPNKPSELIRLALSDLEKCQKMKSRGINMTTWRSVEKNGVCYVCFAGAVMDRTLKLKDTNLLDLPSKIKDKLIALNYFRQGLVYYGLISLGIFELFKCVKIPTFRGQGIPFKKAMYKLANDLEKEGL